MLRGTTYFSSSWPTQQLDKGKFAWTVALGLLFLLALYFRTSGLFRGLAESATFYHPDEPKQILALFNFLNGDYVRYYGSLFYDGYPYGLNHLDEYLLRPFLLLFNSHIPDQHSLYYYARILRVLYGLVVMAICYFLIFKLTVCRLSSLLGVLLFAISPLPITVTHFATGDIGVDLFAALCFLFLFLYLTSSYKNLWLVLAGLAVGGAFSAKYNGLLVGIVPATALFLQYVKEKRLDSLLSGFLLLGAGALLGLVLFTPHILLETKPTIANIRANFDFIKNYQIPASILNKPWYEKAILGLKQNSLFIIASLGKTIFLISILGIVLTSKHYLTCTNTRHKQQCSKHIYLLSLSLFSITVLIISLSGKYVVQPFHFSYLMLPLIIVSCVLFHQFYNSHNSIVQLFGFLMITLVILESGSVCLKENFFWRLEDNNYHAQELPASIYTRAALYTYSRDPIRSLSLEPSGNSVFRNRRQFAEGPDAAFWKAIEVAPLPQTAAPVGKNYIFLNGPAFPRNEKTVIVRGGAYGKTVNKYLILPAGEDISGLGIRCGSYATEAFITIGKEKIHSTFNAHQQKFIPLQTVGQPDDRSNTQKGQVQIIPLQVTVPHNAIWLTILTRDKDVEVFTLFGDGGNAPQVVPDAMPPDLKKVYHDALSHIRYQENPNSQRVNQGQKIPLWEVAIPAGRYTLIAEIDGIEQRSVITMYFEDAKGELHQGHKQEFQITRGLQRIRYNFSKPFVPYQMRFVVSGKEGSCRIRNLKLIPDHVNLEKDFSLWRVTGTPPHWIDY